MELLQVMCCQIDYRSSTRLFNLLGNNTHKTFFFVLIFILLEKKLNNLNIFPIHRTKK
jgi:hypothetical protein